MSGETRQFKICECFGSNVTRDRRKVEILRRREAGSFGGGQRFPGVGLVWRRGVVSTRTRFWSRTRSDAIKLTILLTISTIEFKTSSTRISCPEKGVKS